MDDSAAVATFLFTDIEGSTRLWEEEPERMRQAMARHDALVREAVLAHGGRVVKMTGDGLHAVFDDPLAALRASVHLQEGLSQLEGTLGVPLRARCGMHAGVFERRDNDYYGTAVNRAARIMSAAHGGQVLVSQAVGELVGGRLPEGVGLRDLGAARLRDLARAERLYQVIAPLLRTDFPPLRSLEDTPNNLPNALSSFVGRERELAETRELLRRSRLLTLTGMGGIGKTRIALQVTAEELDAYPDGVWLVELGPLHDGQRVAQAVASAMGVQEEPGRPVLEALQRHVRDRQLLVILDNCEHLLEACAGLARDVLSSGAGVRVLATSREPLRVAGENTYPITGLAAPSPGEAVDTAVAAGYEAVRLFVDRARAAVPGFALGARNAASVAAICEGLDGIPLALELAAARVRSLPVEDIAARLKDRFRLLTVGDPSALPRHRTLRATIDWSYDLLPPSEQALLRRLAVFAGGWTLEAAEAVCADDAAGDGESVLHLLGRLVEKSLVMVDEAARRYRLLETVREYALERLEAPGEAPATRERHLAFFVEMAESAKPHLMGPEQGRWLARLDLERENVLSAHAWAQRSPGAGEAGLRLVGEMKFYWINRGLLELGQRVMAEALAHPGAGEPAARFRGIFHAGQLLYWMGRYAEARHCLEEGLAIARKLGAPRGVSSVLQPLGMAAMAQGELAIARRYLEEALGLARAQGEKRQLAGALNALAQLDRVEGHPERTEPLYAEAIRLLREVDDTESLAIALINLAMVAIMQRREESARGAALDALAASGETRSHPVGQGILDVCAGLATLRGDWNGAARFYGAAESQASRTGVRRDPADQAFLAPRIEQARAALTLQAFAAVEAAGRAISYEEALREAGAWLRAGKTALVAPAPEITAR